MLPWSVSVSDSKQEAALSLGNAPLVWWDRLLANYSRVWSFVGKALFFNRSVCAGRLMVAVHTDMVEYSRLFANDDTGTVARLRDLRRGLVAPAIRRHRGRLVQTAGDSMLITFGSVTEAVKCAVTIQRELAIQNNDWPAASRMRLRVGIDLGDVILDGGDFHGDGVIIAARLQAVCPPGGVCISQAVHDRGGDRLGLPSERLGLLKLKNITRPVDAFVLWPIPHEMATARRLMVQAG
jgi:class 3 adenylate cyclase